MRIEDLLDFVIVRDVPEPAVKLDEQDYVNFILLYVVQHSHKFRAAAVLLSCGDPFIRVQADDLHLMLGGVVGQ